MARHFEVRIALFLAVASLSNAQRVGNFMDALQRLQSLEVPEMFMEGVWPSETFSELKLTSVYNDSADILEYLRQSVSHDCDTDLWLWLQKFADKEVWAQHMFDASGKLPPGVLKGDLTWLGDYSECLSINASHDGITTQYCAVTTQIKDYVPIPITLRWDVCLPNSCTAGNITSFMRFVLPLILQKYLFVYCINDSKPPFTSGAYGMIGLLSAFCIVIIAATVYDLVTSHKPVTHCWSLWSRRDAEQPLLAHPEYGVSPEIAAAAATVAVVHEAGIIARQQQLPPQDVVANEQHAPTRSAADDDVPLILIPRSDDILHGVVRKHVLSFSALENTRRILTVDSATHAAADGATLHAIHGIRFLSMSWVMLGHTWAFCIYTSRNGLDLQDIAKRFTFQAILNATVSVDTFFLLSGTLVSYLLLRQLRRCDGPLHINWVKFVLHRYLRLTPVYMILLGFLATLFIYIGNGPLWPQSDPTGALYSNCDKHWWTNLFYINNLVYPDEQCFGWAWYLANDMQLFLLSLPFIVVLYKWAVVGVVAAVMPVIISCITTGVITAKHNYPAAMSMAVQRPNFNTQQWMDDIYFPPWCRAGPYFVGILLGYVLFRINCRLRLHWALSLLFWCLAAACNLSVLYGLYGAVNHYVYLSEAVSSFYAAVHRTAWALGVAWVIFACVTGNGGYVNSLLSWSAFVPLSRLSYVAYLIHPMVMIFYYFSLHTLIDIRNVTMTYIFLGHLVVTYMLSFIVSLAFEAPVIRFMKLAFGEEK